MQLMQKEDMLLQEWNTFEHYPKQGSSIVLHIRGYKIRASKYCHDFIAIPRFNARSFDKTSYIPDIDSLIKWEYTWLPQKSLMVKK